MKKEKKQLRYPGLKAGSIYGTVIFFIIPLIDTLTSENQNFISSLLNTKHIFKTILGAFFFGVMMHIVDSLSIDSQKTRILNLALCFMMLSLLQLMVISSNWKYYLLLTIASLSSITYLYYLYQFVKESQ